MTADQPVQPANILNIVAINQGRRPLTMEAPTAPRLTAATFRELMAQGALALDTRSTAAFGGGHIPGAYHVHLSSSEFEQRVGWVLPLDAPLLLVCDQDAEVERALHALAFVGLDSHVRGYLGGGVGAWTAAGRALELVPQVTVQELVGWLDAGTVRLLDVRERVEWNAGHIEGATHMSYRQLSGQVDRLGFGADEPIAIICRGGLRSSTASSLLLRAGYRNLHNVIGGMDAWSAAGLPKVESIDCAR
jgi:hydroxyacylglutathione hydrolase